MKAIINILLAIIVLGASDSAFSAADITIYHGIRSDALLINSNGERVLMLSGGAISRGDATAGDCFVQSHIELKKAPNSYEGSLDPASNEIVEINKDQIDGRGLGLYLYRQKINIGGVQVTGICADGIDLSGQHNQIKKSTDLYKQIFLYFTNLAHENSNSLFGRKNIDDAIQEIRPFVENYEDSWLADSNSANILIPVINDYAFFLQNVGKNLDALVFLQIVIKNAPNRTVAWLNIADSYWSEKSWANARSCYLRYVSLMRANTMAGNIPKRALERANLP